MCAVEVCLFDVSSEELTPVEQGSVIWVRTEISREPWESLTLAQARPRSALELLQRVLEYEGLSGRFVLEPASGEYTTLKAFGGLEPREERPLYDDPGGLRFTAQGRRAEQRIEIAMPAGEVTGPHAAGTTVGELVRRHGCSALSMYLLSAHYSQPLGELGAGMREAAARVERVREVAARLETHSPGPPDMDGRMRAFRKTLARDLDAPAALRVMFEWLRAAELRPDRIGDSHLQEMLGLLALDELLEEESAGEPERRPLH
jgi:hypothetical protein